MTLEMKNILRTSEAGEVILNLQIFNYGHTKLQNILFGSE